MHPLLLDLMLARNFSTKALCAQHTILVPSLIALYLSMDMSPMNSAEKKALATMEKQVEDLANGNARILLSAQHSISIRSCIIFVPRPRKEARKRGPRWRQVFARRVLVNSLIS